MLGSTLCTSVLQSKDLYADTIESPDQQDNNSNYNTDIESKYYDVKHTSKYFDIGDKGFTLLHCNTRSLSKNLSLLNDILITCKETPSIIAISETKLKEDGVCNISIDGYRFISKHSPTNAGGVGIYIKNDIEFFRRQDLDCDFEGVETCFIEIPRTKGETIVVGCIYRHPTSNIENCRETLSVKLELIKRRSNFDSSNSWKQIPTMQRHFSVESII